MGPLYGARVPIVAGVSHRSDRRWLHRTAHKLSLDVVRVRKFASGTSPFDANFLLKLTLGAGESGSISRAFEVLRRDT